jgi:hypothetical protein
MAGPILLEGTLRADGTVELDSKPALPPGRVQVVLQPIMATPSARQGLAEVIQQIEGDQAARGYKGRTPEEMAAAEASRLQEDADYEARWQAIWSQTQSGPPK